MAEAREPTGNVETQSDGELARLVAQGDQSAASVLIRRYERLVRSFLCKITGRFELADDLAQETFVRLLKNAHRYDESYPMRTWLLTIARRLSINYGRRMDEQVASTEYEGRRSGADGPAQQVEAADTRAATRVVLDQALAQLSEPQRLAVVLFHEQDLSLEDVARVMEMPVGTIKSHLHRGRSALRKILEPNLEVLST